MILRSLRQEKKKKNHELKKKTHETYVRREGENK